MTFHGGVTAGRYISYIHTRHDAAVNVLLDLPEGWGGSSGHVIRSDAVGVSRRYFSEEKICVVFQVISRGQVSCCCPGRTAARTGQRLIHGHRHTQTHTPAAAVRAAADGGGVVSFLVRDWARWSTRVHVSPRAPHTQLVTTGAITGLRTVTRWVKGIFNQVWAVLGSNQVYLLKYCN